MISSIDTNILIDVLSAGPHFAVSADRLDELAKEGTLAIGEVVYAELAAAFAGESAVDAFLSSLGIRVLPSSRAALRLAGETWNQYTRNRAFGIRCGGCGRQSEVACSSCGAVLTSRQHIVADFMIGAHASLHADQLFTRDRRFYSRYFPQLTLA